MMMVFGYPTAGSPEWFKASLDGTFKVATPKSKAASNPINTAMNGLINLPDTIKNTAQASGEVFQGLNTLPKNPTVQKALGDVAHNLGAAALQDGETLKPNVALIATLVHVMMRVKEAYDSSNAPASSPQEQQYNQEQSAMTYFREVVGFSTGFLLLKRLQKMFGSQMATQFGYEKKKYGRVSIGQSLQQGVGLLRGTLQPQAIYRMPQALPNHTSWNRTEAHRPVNTFLAQMGYALEKESKAEWIFQPAFIKRAWNMVAGTDVKDALTAAVKPDKMLAENLIRWEGKGFELAHKQLPVYLGTIPSVLIAGFGVEYASLHYGKKVKKYMLGLMEALHVIPKQDPNKTSSNQDENMPVNKGIPFKQKATRGLDHGA
jgi:hypothetical protein